MDRKLLVRACVGLSFAVSALVPQIFAQATQRNAAALSAASASTEEKQYDLLLKGGHVIDPKNNLDAIRDVAIKDGKVAKVAAAIPGDSAIKTVDVTGLYVTPGLIDIHVHVFWGLKKNDYADGDWSIAPDGFTLKDGVTTVVDAGSSGWRNFEVFKERVVDRSITRVLVMLNIVGAGMGSGEIEQNTKDMDGQKTGELALKYPGVIVGVKSAHFTGPEWLPYDQAIKAGTMAHIPVMIDYGSRRLERPLYQLLEEKLRPGDIYTHMYMGGRGEQDAETGGPGKGMWEGRKRGVYFDVGHGGASFNFSVAVPLIKAGFIPDSISTDIHSDNVNAGMKGQLTTADKILAMGLSLKEVIAEMTWHPALEVQQTQLGNLSEGAIADIAVLAVHHGNFGLVDGSGAKMMGHEKLECELTLKDGKFVYDLNGLSADPWDHPPAAASKQASKWTTLRTPGAMRPNQQAAAAARVQQRPGRWQPYETDANGNAKVKANAKLAPTGTSKAKLSVPPPASTWPTPPSASWPSRQQ
jgi:dihydroorotase